MLPPNGAPGRAGARPGESDRVRPRRPGATRARSLPVATPHAGGRGGVGRAAAGGDSVAGPLERRVAMKVPRRMEVFQWGWSAARRHAQSRGQYRMRCRGRGNLGNGSAPSTVNGRSRLPSSGGKSRRQSGHHPSRTEPPRSISATRTVTAPPTRRTRSACSWHRRLPPRLETCLASRSVFPSRRAQ